MQLAHAHSRFLLATALGETETGQVNDVDRLVGEPPHTFEKSRIFMRGAPAYPEHTPRFGGQHLAPEFGELRCHRAPGVGGIVYDESHISIQRKPKLFDRKLKFLRHPSRAVGWIRRID